jgi:uncharacterized CHY-type Zn-finger protein
MTTEQVRLCHSYADVFFIDATYCTNRYGVPLVHAVVLDGVGRIRLACAALMTRETEEDYLWFLNQFVEATGCHPKCTISDEAAAITKALSISFPSAKHFKCKFHLWNNLSKHIPRSWDEADVDRFKLDLQCVERSHSSGAFSLRAQALLKKYSDPELAGQFHKLYSIADKWAGFVRAQHSSLRYSSASVEVAHHIFKSFTDANYKSYTLEQVVDVSLKVIDQQAEGAILDEIEATQANVGGRLDGMDISRFVLISEQIKVHCSKAAIISLNLAFKKLLSVSQTYLLTRAQYDTIAQNNFIHLGNLPSDEGAVVRDIAPRVANMAFSESALIFRCDLSHQEDCPQEILSVHSHLIVYDLRSLDYACTCDLRSLSGYVCAHFLACYRTDTRVLHHPLLWHPRWLIDPRTSLAPAASLEACSVKPQRLQVPCEIAEELRKSALQLFGPRIVTGQPRLMTSASSVQCEVLYNEYKKVQGRITASMLKCKQNGNEERMQSILASLRALTLTQVVLYYRKRHYCD